MKEISPVQLRLMGREAKEYGKQLARRSTEALVRSIKEQSGLAHMAFVDLGGGLLGWGADVGLRYATLGLQKQGTGIRGWIAQHASLVSGSLSGAVGATGYIANALTNTKAPLSWPREVARAASGTLGMFGLDRNLTAALGLPKL